MRESGTWNGEVGSGGETAKTTTERTDGRTTIQDRWISGRTSRNPPPSPGDTPRTDFPTNARSGGSPKRSPGQAGRPHFRRPKLAFLTGVDRTPRKELFPGAVDGISSRSLDCSGLDEEHGEDRGSGWTSGAHAGTTPSRGPTITGLADDQAWLGGWRDRPLYIVRVRPALVWGELLQKRKRQSTQWLDS